VSVSVSELLIASFYAAQFNIFFMEAMAFPFLTAFSLLGAWDRPVTRDQTSRVGPVWNEVFLKEFQRIAKPVFY